MEVLYRLNCGASIHESSATLYSYPIIKETASYYEIRSGSNNRRIKKEDIGRIQAVDIERTMYKVFLTNQLQLKTYTNDMLELVKLNALKQIERYKAVSENSIMCEIKEEFVKPE